MSPFKSKAQARFMFAKHPKLAEEWASKTRSIKSLPNKMKHKMSKKAAKKKSLLKRAATKAFRGY